MTIPATYENGVFKPLEDVKLTEGTRVEVHVPAEGAHQSGPNPSGICRSSGCGPTAATSLTA